MKPCPATVQLKYYVRHIYNFNVFSRHTLKSKKNKKRQKFKVKLISMSYLSQYIQTLFQCGINAKQLHIPFSS